MTDPSAKLVTNPQRLQLVLSFLPANEAFGAAKVSQAFRKAQESLDARVFLSQIRPETWLHKNEMDQDFNRCLLRDWHLCLRHSAMQVAYVDYRQHLIYIEPSCSLTGAPQGSDPFPVAVDNENYRCSIEPFNSDCLWWDCLQGELFEWPRKADNYVEALPQLDPVPPGAGYVPVELPVEPEAVPAPQGAVFADPEGPGDVPVELPFELEAVPGYHGSLAIPKFPDDVMVILSLNAAWFNYSFWTRQLQGMFLLRDGRFLLVGSCEMQGTIDSQASARVYRGFVANSLASLVTFGQDPRSREILRTRVVGPDDAKPSVKPTELLVSIPRVQSDDAQDFEKRFGPFRRASKSCENVLFSTLEVDQDEGRKNLQVGDRVRVVRRGDTFIWSSCRAEAWAAPQGAVSPQLDTKYLERASQEDGRFTTFSGGCHLGLRRDRWYEAEVVHLNADNTLDLKYIQPREWSNGASGFTDGQGNDRSDTPIEADVAIERAKVLPKSRWYWAFQDVWELCGGFSSVSLSFADRGGPSVRCFANSNCGEAEKEAESKAAEVPFLKLADVFADTAEAHRFRCKTLFEEKDVFDRKDIKDIEKLSAETVYTDGRLYPRGDHMALCKRLFLQLLRTSFWDKWIAQGGESPSKIIHLFKKDKFVRLIIQ
ncbi:unnamed protein product [Durusdinium trenchii]|uniref:F-box domain-containing protein n=1 Tax=Durusdinium trenchii TaxID=1381693 RepID=A0ABP0QB96_9DINO